MYLHPPGCCECSKSNDVSAFFSTLLLTTFSAFLNAHYHWISYQCQFCGALLPDAKRGYVYSPVWSDYYMPCGEMFCKAWVVRDPIEDIQVSLHGYTWGATEARPPSRLCHATGQHLAFNTLLAYHHMLRKYGACLAIIFSHVHVFFIQYRTKKDNKIPVKGNDFLPYKYCTC